MQQRAKNDVGTRRRGALSGIILISGNALLVRCPSTYARLARLGNFKVVLRYFTDLLTNKSFDTAGFQSSVRVQSVQIFVMILLAKCTCKPRKD